MVEIVPGAVVFRSADPDVEVGVNPRARNQRLQPAKILVPRDGLGNRDGFHAGLALQRVVEAAQKFPPRLRVIFPGILAVENDRNHGITALIKHRLGRLLDVAASDDRAASCGGMPE